jgi:hypothetical protein
MIGTRRSFVGGAIGAALAWRGGWAQAAPPTAAGRAFAAAIGEEMWTELRQRLVTVNADIRAHGLRTIPGVKATLLTGYPYNEFYDWDLYFENLYLSYYGVWTYCFTNLREFLDRQQPDGYVNRSLIKQRDRQHFKPFLAQLAVLGSRQNKNDYEWVRGNYYERLGKYLTKWFSYDGDKNGLPVWNSADAAGTDNQWSRGGALGAFEIEGVDPASYLVRELRAMAAMAHQLGLAGDVKRYNDEAGRLIKVMNATFWDEADGMYYDRNEKTGKLVKVKSATCFMPLFAGAATPDRAGRMVRQHLLNEKEFWLAYPVASYAKTEPDLLPGLAQRVQLARSDVGSDQLHDLPGLDALRICRRSEDSGGPVAGDGGGEKRRASRVLRRGDGPGAGADALLGVHRAVLRYAAGVAVAV